MRRALTPLASVCAAFERARERIPRAELPQLLMNDPGHGAYVAAYERVLDSGVRALFEHGEDGLPLMASFDITENLLLSHSQAGQSLSHRWFSVMTAGIELLGASTHCFAPLSRTLGALLSDSFALADAHVAGAPVDLLPLVCRELKANRSDPHDRSLAVLGELLTATLTDAEVEANCRELWVRHDEAQKWYAADGEQNHFFAARPEFVWGAVLSRSELPTWLGLVRSRFPSHPELARETRERLLREGEAWIDLGAGVQ